MTLDYIYVIKFDYVLASGIIVKVLISYMVVIDHDIIFNYKNSNYKIENIINF